MSKFIRSFSLFLVLFLSFTGYAAADDFLATRSAIIHEEDNSASKEVGRLNQGDRVPILDRNSDETYFKIRTQTAIEGWVSKSRGKVIYSAPLATTTTTTSSSATFNFYFGNLHSHVSELSRENNISKSTYEEAFTYAMDKGNLDFMAITIHNHLAEPDAYAKLISITNDPMYYKTGKFAPIAGQEFSTLSSGNHINIFEADAWIDPSEVPNGEFKEFYEIWIPKHKTKYTSLQFNHPNSTLFAGYKRQEYGRDDYEDNIQSLLKATDKLVSMIEIISANTHNDATNKPHVDENTTRLNAYLFALNEGWHLAPAANQDNHRKNWGTSSSSRTACIAKELTKEAILNAIKNSRCYATEDENMKVTFKAGNYWMGSVVDIHEISGLYIKAEDDGEPNAMYTVRLYMDKIDDSKLTINSKPIKTFTLKNKEEAIFPIDNPETDTYYFLRVTQSKNQDDPNGTEDDAWTAPIWVSEISH